MHPDRLGLRSVVRRQETVPRPKEKPMTKLVRRTLLAAAVLLTVPAAAGAQAPSPQAIYGLSEDGRELVLFNSAAPGHVIYATPLRNVPAGETIVGIDVRPANQRLYALGATSRIYTVDAATGVLRQVGTDPFTPAVSGAQFGFDFNPAADRLRIVTDTDQNLRLNPDTGQGTGPGGSAADGNLAYAPGDPNAGQNPTIGATAYTNNVPGADSTAQFNVDTERNVLVRQNPPNAGTLSTIGPLGIDATAPVGLDVSGDNQIAYMSSRTGTGAGLFTVNLVTGSASPAVSRNAIGAGVLRDIAVAGPAPAPENPVLSVAVSSTQLVSRLLSRGLVVSASCSAACELTGRVTVGGRQAATATGAVARRAGRTTLTFPLDRAARDRIRREGNTLLRLRITSQSSSGATRTQDRDIRAQTLAARRAGG
jgi:hypothetical protein